MLAVRARAVTGPDHRGLSAPLAAATYPSGECAPSSQRWSRARVYRAC
jgi:hypothetical protein